MKILLIEDNQSICKGLEYAFKSNGYECEIANSISSSKYIISNYNPQLIVLDVSLPDGNGFDLYIDTHKAETEQFRYLLKGVYDYEKCEDKSENDC